MNVEEAKAAGLVLNPDATQEMWDATIASGRDALKETKFTEDEYVAYYLLNSIAPEKTLRAIYKEISK